MVFGKNTLNSKEIINSKDKISHVDVPLRYSVLIYFKYITLHTKKPKNMTAIALAVVTAAATAAVVLLLLSLLLPFLIQLVVTQLLQLQSLILQCCNC